MSGITRRALLAGTIALPALARAQVPWPSQPIKFVVPFTPGGSTVVLAHWRKVIRDAGIKIG